MCAWCLISSAAGIRRGPRGPFWLDYVVESFKADFSVRTHAEHSDLVSAPVFLQRPLEQSLLLMLLVISSGHRTPALYQELSQVFT